MIVDYTIQVPPLKNQQRPDARSYRKRDALGPMKNKYHNDSGCTLGRPAVQQPNRNDSDDDISERASSAPCPDTEVRFGPVTRTHQPSPHT